MEEISLEERKVWIYYDDHSGRDQVVKKEGRVLRDTGRILIFRNAAGYTEAIPWYRIVRVIQIPHSEGDL